MGVLATRSPHRPAPVGLSIARIIEVRGNKLVLGGADIVDGSPVLDIKPYVPFCDSVPGAVAPDWVQVRAAWLTHGSMSCAPWARAS
jgi:tRNA (Thr-GGU) A37 N-methylase